TISIAGITFHIVRKGDSDRRYVWLHGDEPTAKDVLVQHMETHPGQALFIESAERNVRLNGGWLNPNRMFSRVGAEKNLRKLNPSWGRKQLEVALDHLDQERDTLFRVLLPPAGGLLVALHNNWEDFNVHSEIPLSNRVALSDPDHPRDFYICTNSSDFAQLSCSPYNVVLQEGNSLVDDGSLSPLAGRRNMRYVNIEAKLGAFDKQKAMLGWLEKALP
ncbi:MAG: hypothetical protein GXO92_03305, partial [FCB group bacterium]|nr:hypothetical protein [FCB group bacterium]